ncbi:hypothetical protein BDF21DRAFT_455826 [Thamnidium elegans]|nr:hypothetical protein BDF21DRAFT_455826 [Thamnidium elegans]
MAFYKVYQSIKNLMRVFLSGTRIILIYHHIKVLNVAFGSESMNMRFFRFGASVSSIDQIDLPLLFGTRSTLAFSWLFVLLVSKHSYFVNFYLKFKNQQMLGLFPFLVVGCVAFSDAVTIVELTKVFQIIKLHDKSWQVLHR